MAEGLGSALQKLLQQFESARYLLIPLQAGFYFTMLTPQEQQFIDYWREQRLKKKSFLRKLSIGLPMGTLIAVAIMINFLSGWYKKADMELHSDASVIIVVLIAVVAIVIFMTVFSARYQYEQNEQRYQELLAKSKID